MTNEGGAAPPRQLLILSDGRPGHLNQSLAFAKLLGYSWQVRRVVFKSRFCKALSYLADRVGLQFPGLFRVEGEGADGCAVVSAGSETYYANRVLARRLGVPAVAIMLPNGYRYDFDLIVAQEHDAPPQRDNIVALPVNLSYVEPTGLVSPRAGRMVISLIVGGDSRHSQLDASLLHQQVTEIFRIFPDHDIWLTTSPRTSGEVEGRLRAFPFAYAVYYSQQKINPIPDFLQHSEYVFLTADSSSMISEAVSYGTANIEVLPLVKQGKAGKIERMTNLLEKGGYLHTFDGTIAGCSRKLNLKEVLRNIELIPGAWSRDE